MNFEYLIPENFIKQKEYISELDQIFDSGRNVILQGEKGSGTSSTSIFYAIKNKIFDTKFLIESESKDKVEFELNSWIGGHKYIKPISLLEQIENSIDSQRILIILDQVENFKHVEHICKKFENKANFLITTHKFLGHHQNFVQLKQLPFNFQKAAQFLFNTINEVFSIQSKDIENLVRFLMKKQEFIIPFTLSKIVSIFKFNYSFYSNEDLLNKVYNHSKSPTDFLLEIIFEKPSFNILATMLLFDHKFINLSLIESFFNSKRSHSYAVRTSLNTLKKMSLISNKIKNGEKGIVIHDLVHESTLRYINKEQQYMKKFGNIYEDVLNFYLDCFGTQFQDGIMLYNHVKKILSIEFNFLSSVLSDLKIKRVKRLKSRLYYSMALFRFSHLINYNECSRLCSLGKLDSDIHSEFDELISKCGELNFDFDQESTVDNVQEEATFYSENNGQLQSTDVLPVLMNSDDIHNWLKEKMISQTIIQYLTPIDGSQLMDYFVLLTNDNLFFELILEKEIPNATKDEISLFSKSLKQLFIQPLGKTNF